MLLMASLSLETIKKRPLTAIRFGFRPIDRLDDAREQFYGRSRPTNHGFLVCNRLLKKDTKKQVA